MYPFEMFIACTDMTQNADIIGRPIFAPTEYKEYVYSIDLAKITPKSISKMYLYSLLSKKNRGFLKSVICGRIKPYKITPYHKKDYRHEQI